MSDVTPSASDPAARKLNVPLMSPVPAHGGEIVELSFREPTGLDITTIGNPLKIDFGSNPPAVTFDAPVMTAMLAQLAGVPPSTINKLSGRDWVTCAWAASVFFVPSKGTL